VPAAKARDPGEGMMNHILIIDDQRLIRNSLKVALEKEAYTVHLARTGAEGINIVREHDVDLVLLDIMLPDINGIEVLKKIAEIFQMSPEPKDETNS
jgi:DNA-binding response OmpR family regulator